MGITKAKKIEGGRVRAYGCTWHHVRGNKVCSITYRQDIEEVEEDLAEWIQTEVLTAKRVALSIETMRWRLEKQLAHGCARANRLRSRSSRAL
jgi:hypothetical protein